MNRNGILHKFTLVYKFLIDKATMYRQQLNVHNDDICHLRLIRKLYPFIDICDWMFPLVNILVYVCWRMLYGLGAFEHLCWTFGWHNYGMLCWQWIRSTSDNLLVVAQLQRRHFPVSFDTISIPLLLIEMSWIRGTQFAVSNAHWTYELLFVYCCSSVHCDRVCPDCLFSDSKGQP